MHQTAEYQTPGRLRQAELRAQIDALRSADRREIMRLKNGSLDYQCAVNALLIDLDGAPRFPMLSEDELEGLASAFDHNVPVTEFVMRIRMVRESLR